MDGFNPPHNGYPPNPNPNPGFPQMQSGYPPPPVNGYSFPTQGSVTSYQQQIAAAGDKSQGFLATANSVTSQRNGFQGFQSQSQPVQSSMNMSMQGQGQGQQNFSQQSFQNGQQPMQNQQQFQNGQQSFPNPQQSFQNAPQSLNPQFQNQNNEPFQNMGMGQDNQQYGNNANGGNAPMDNNPGWTSGEWINKFVDFTCKYLDYLFRAPEIARNGGDMRQQQTMINAFLDEIVQVESQLDDARISKVLPLMANLTSLKKQCFESVHTADLVHSVAAFRQQAVGMHPGAMDMDSQLQNVIEFVEHIRKEAEAAIKKALGIGVNDEGEEEDALIKGTYCDLGNGVQKFTKTITITKKLANANATLPPPWPACPLGQQQPQEQCPTEACYPKKPRGCPRPKPSCPLPCPQECPPPPCPRPCPPPPCPQQQCPRPCPPPPCPRPCPPQQQQCPRPCPPPPCPRPCPPPPCPRPCPPQQQCPRPCPPPPCPQPCPPPPCPQPCPQQQCYKPKKCPKPCPPPPCQPCPQPCPAPCPRPRKARCPQPCPTVCQPQACPSYMPPWCPRPRNQMPPSVIYLPTPKSCRPKRKPCSQPLCSPYTQQQQQQQQQGTTVSQILNGLNMSPETLRNLANHNIPPQLSQLVGGMLLAVDNGQNRGQNQSYGYSSNNQSCGGYSSNNQSCGYSRNTSCCYDPCPHIPTCPENPHNPPPRLSLPKTPDPPPEPPVTVIQEVPPPPPEIPPPVPPPPPPPAAVPLPPPPPPPVEIPPAIPPPPPPVEVPPPPQPPPPIPPPPPPPEMPPPPPPPVIALPPPPPPPPPPPECPDPAWVPVKMDLNLEVMVGRSKYVLKDTKTFTLNKEVQL